MFNLSLTGVHFEPLLKWKQQVEKNVKVRHLLGEASTIAIVKTKNPKVFIGNKLVAMQGQSVAGKAKHDLEAKTGKKVVSTENYLPPTKKDHAIG